MTDKATLEYQNLVLDIAAKVLSGMQIKDVDAIERSVRIAIRLINEVDSVVNADE